MKYIYNRDKYLKIILESADSDNITPDFSDTLIGGTLHRLLGFVRSKKRQGQMSKYSRELDRLLASIVIENALKSIDEEKTGDDKITIEDIEEDGAKIEVVSLVISSIKKYMDGDEEESKKILDIIPKEKTLFLPQSAQNAYTKLSEYYQLNQNNEEIEDEESSDESSELDNYNIKGDDDKEVSSSEISKNVDGNDESSENKDGSIKEKYRRLIKLMHPDKYHNLNLSKKDKEILKKYSSKLSDAYNSNSIDLMSKLEIDFKKEFNINDIFKKDLQDTINKYKKDYKSLTEFCNRCAPNNKKLRDYINDLQNLINNISSFINEDNLYENPEIINKINDIKNNINKKIKIAYEQCKSCEINKNHEVVLEKLLLEYRDSTQVLTQKEFNKIRKDIEKESKKWKVSEQDMKEINDKANQKGIAEVTGNEAKSLMDILTKAKDALLHPKPYDEIRKKQKRYYDKLSSGRAINRKGYQTWVKKVNEIVSYYKDQLPDKVKTLITDSLDKKNIENDYVTLHQEFLGINNRKNNNGYGFNNYDKDDEYITNYKVGDTISYKRTNGKMNDGVILKIGKNELDVKTSKGEVTILKKRVKEVVKKK